jgi:hypothetical protein
MTLIDDPQANPSGPPRPRTCGRCRGSFAGDATLVDIGLQEWWACPVCRESLLPGMGGT